jgi:hypothetical protein
MMAFAGTRVARSLGYTAVTLGACAKAALAPRRSAIAKPNTR